MGDYECDVSRNDGLSAIFVFENYWECVEEYDFYTEICLIRENYHIFEYYHFPFLKGVRCCTVCNPLGGYHLSRPLRPIT